MESLAKLPTVFKKDGVVTAGSASGICDGAASVLLSSESAASKHNLTPLARLVAYSTVGVPPEIMGFGPVPAIQNVLKAANLTMDDIDLIEVNKERIISTTVAHWSWSLIILLLFLDKRSIWCSSTCLCTSFKYRHQ